MSTTGPKLNGSIERLAVALRDVVSEASEAAAEKAVKPLEERMSHFDRRLDLQGKCIIALAKGLPEEARDEEAIRALEADIQAGEARPR